LRLVNKKCLESLAYAGALDGLRGTRAQLFASIDKAVDYGVGFQKDRVSGQTSLFDSGGEGGAAVKSMAQPQLAAVEPWPYNELLAKEKEVLNFYVSGHPLMRFEDEIRGFADVSLRGEAVEKLKEGTPLTVGGIITNVKTHMQRDGKPMAFLMIEDFGGSMELLVFGDAYEKYRHLLAADSMVLVHGQVSVREGDKKPKLRVDKVLALSETREKLTKSIHVRLRTRGLEESFVREVYDACAHTQGPCALIIHLATEENNEYRIKAKNVQMNPAREALETLRGKVGKENVWIGKSAA
jgi:DNA polymerase-3 subunit alpha